MAAYIPDEDVYWSLKLEILQEMRAVLVQNLAPEKFFAYFRSRRIFDADDCDMIQAERLKRKKGEMFLDILESKGPNAFNEFCNFIRDNKTQVWILKKINESFEKKKRDTQVHTPQEVNDEDKDKPVTVDMTSNISTPSLVIPPSNLPPNSMLPGPPTPPDELPSHTFEASSINDDSTTETTTLTGNSVSQATSPAENYPGPPLPPYSSEPPSSPPPPYRE